ncbi:MAG: S8 family serine peptidase, partial [Chloroflexi bacterium]|nr:S8 family serine peptidase [Chloroflexota bacterium]
MSMDSKKNRPLLLLLALLLAFVLVGATVLLTGAAPARVVDVPDAAPTSAANNVSENTPQTSHRLIVQLESPSLAEHSAQEGVWRTENGRLDFNAPEAQAYIAQLEAEQKAFIGEMQTAVPTLSIAGYINESGQAVAATYQIVFNGVAIDAGKAATLEQAQRELLKIEGTRAVYRDYAHYPQTYTSTQLINAPVVWNMAGGQGNAGTGVKVASMDGGLHHDAPMFDGSGWSYPPGWPAGGLGDSANNNGKIIASRAYFRDWDPPAPGDENSWPGVAGISHGTHTGSTAAGNHAPQDYLGVPVDVTGVAPGAWLMSYRVFYASVTDDGSFYNVEGIAALEDLVADGADVVNNSWGEGPGSGGGPFDPLDQALVNASTAGVFVSMATGNSGPGNGTADHPSDDYINVAASTTDGTFLAGKASVPISATLQDMPLGKARFGPPLPAMVVTYSYTAAISVEPGNYRGCSPFTGTPFAGGAALISHGSCSYGNKVYYAQQAGAQFVIIYNHAGDSVRKMGFSCNYSSTCSASDITISAIFIGQSNGEAMVNIFDNDRPNAIVVVDNIAYQAGNTPDQIASFSSRGPGVGNVLKPDIAAPGVIIMAQGYDPLATGEARHLGIAQASGTSMAAPHVAGAATILRQLYPTWTNAQIKSALMSTSKYIDIYNEDGSPAQPLDMGAGRLDLTNAADPGIFLDPPSLSFGQMVTGTTSTIDVTLTNVTTATETYSVTTLYTGDGFTATMPVAGLTVSPTMVTLTPGGSTTVQAMFDAAMSMGIGDNQGYVAMSGDNGHNAHMPAWARIVPLPDAEVLIIDADASPGLGFPDYLSYYTAVLDNLSLTYDILDWATTGIPEQAVLAPYKTIILFTGDFNLANNVTKIEMDHLTEYANSGGIILAMGQDMTDVLGTTFFRKSVLGIPSPLQDSVTNGLLPDAAVVTRPDALPAFAGVNLDLSGPEVNSVTLTGANEVPPVATTMIGTADFGYDNANQVLDYDVTV